ncbi:MAG: hypothetical protein ACK5OW_01000 [bacterium]|jgi:hypothetical protein
MKDLNGNEIKIGDELDVPMDVFSTGIVVTNNKGELCLELRYEGNLLPIKHIKYLKLSSEVFN